MMGGVKAFIVTPKAIPPSNRDRVLLHLHGGVRVFNPGEAGTREGTLMAGFAHYKVITVDYRMPPDFLFPAALDDAVTAYRELLKTTRSENIGIFGASAGGSLTLTTLLARSGKSPDAGRDRTGFAHSRPTAAYGTTLTISLVQQRGSGIWGSTVVPEGSVGYARNG